MSKNEIKIYENMEQSLKLAEIMATGKVMIPEHLRGSQGDCLAVIMQSIQWELNPFVVAQKTFLIKGKLGYEAQLVIAIINAKAPIKDRINFEYKGSGQSLSVKAFCTLNNGTIVYKEVTLASIKVKNSTNWTNDPSQQLAYQSALRLARLHFPDVILGVYIPDELEQINSNAVDEKEIISALEQLGLSYSINNNILTATGNLFAHSATIKSLGFRFENNQWVINIITNVETAQVNPICETIDVEAIETNPVNDLMDYLKQNGLTKEEIGSFVKDTLRLDRNNIDGIKSVLANKDELNDDIQAFLATGSDDIPADLF